MVSATLDLGGRGYGVSGVWGSRAMVSMVLMVWTWVVGATVSMVSVSVWSGYGVDGV